jgi:hypothetical protein
MKARIVLAGFVLLTWLLLALGQLTSGAIIGPIWEFLWEQLPWVAMIFYWNQVAPLRDALGVTGLLLMSVAVVVLLLRSDGRRTSGIFTGASMRSLLRVGALTAAPYAGWALIIGYGLNLVQGRVNLMRFQHLDIARVETWVPLGWVSLWILGWWLSGKVTKHDTRRWAAFRR